MHLTKVKGINPNGTAWNPTLDELLSPQLQVVNNKEDAIGTVYAKLMGNYRRNENVIEKWCFILDIDKSSFDVGKMLTEGLQGFQGCFHTTYSHDPQREMYCYRVILPTDKSVAPDDYETAFLNLVDSNEMLSELRDKSILDMTAKDKGRFYYDFSCPPDREEFAYIHKLDGGTPYIPDTRKRTVDNISSSGQKSINGILKQYSNRLVEGNRNQSLTSKCGGLVAKHLDKDIVSKELHHINRRDCKPPLDESEVDTIINSIFTSHFKNNPQDKQVDSTKPEFSRPCFTIDELQNEPEVEWMVEDLIMARSQCAIYGASGSTKSFLALDMGMHLALGKDWFNYKVYKPVPVLYIACEGGGGFINRINGWIKSHKLAKPRYFLVDKAVIYPNDIKSVENFIGYYKQMGFKDGMIFIDTLNANASASGMDENGKDMGVIHNAFKKIALSLDSAYGVIHHTGKDENKGMRGNSSLYAALDTVIYVKEKHQGSYSWQIDKQREGITGTKYSYTTELVETGFDSKGKQLTTLKLLSGMPEKTDVARESFAPNSHQRTIWNFLKTYLLPIHNKRANIDDFYEYVHQEWSAQNSDQRKSKARKSIDQMKNKGLFKYGTWEDYSTKEKEHDQIWITEKGFDY